MQLNDEVPDALCALLIGDSPPMRQLRNLIRRIAPTDLPVLITGPTGSGKELVANAMHMASGRKGLFVAFNVCAVADTMFEDALFGHARGAFTGATSDSAGYLAQANNGRVFLDEISGLGLPSQAKLLRALETQTFRAVGAQRDQYSKFRIVAASNENLERLSSAGQFRSDLYHRLPGTTVTVPSLASRREDIPLLVRAFAREAGVTLDASGITDAMNMLSAEAWPGNVRQLKHVVELTRALSDAKSESTDGVRAALAMDGAESVNETTYDYNERTLLLVLERAHGNIDAAATALGVHRTTVYRRLARIKRRRGEGAR